MSNTCNDETLRRLAENDPDVKTVHVTPDNFSRVTAALQGNTHVERLDVDIKGAVDRRNELPADDVHADWNEFCRAAQAVPSLMKVWVIMTREEPSDEDWILLGLLLQSTKQIKTLFLFSCYGKGITFPSTAVRRLARNLKEAAGLEYIIFYNFQIQPTDLAPLLLAFSSLPKLTHLYLRSNFKCAPLLLVPMRNEAFISLERLFRKQSLVEFRYDNVAFSVDQADAIANIMSLNFGMEDLSFDQIDVRQSEAAENLNKKIKVITKLNKAGRRYLAELGPECRAAGINVLSAVSEDLDCLYYHLRENLALMSDLAGKLP